MLHKIIRIRFLLKQKTTFILHFALCILHFAFLLLFLIHVDINYLYLSAAALGDIEGAVA